MSTYLNRKSLVGCLFAIGLGGLSSVALAVEDSSDYSPATPASATSKPATATNESKPDHGSIDHSKMSHESMDHDQKTKKAD
ncbi:MAG: hypothetical protein M3Q94_22430 [Pseudomonadota bacterium]|nr:hypothetical protein [Pseudomonadota bacterium]